MLSPKDGTTIGMLDPSLIEAQLFKTNGLIADMTKFNWIGRVISNNSVLFARAAAPVKKIEDAYTKELVIASTGRSSLIRWTVLKSITGMKFNIITGYNGSSGATLALARGEIDALSLPWSVFRVTHADWLRDRKVNLLLQSGIDKAVDLPAVPRLVDLARDDDQRAVLELFSQSDAVGRSFVAPPDLSAERVEDLRAAFAATLEDPDFKADVESRKLVLDPLPGAALEDSILKAFRYPPTLIETARKLAEAN
jgi:tripartite-type tricarboxylate transporter receptor subunit TctC